MENNTNGINDNVSLSEWVASSCNQATVEFQQQRRLKETKEGNKLLFECYIRSKSEAE